LNNIIKFLLFLLLVLVLLVACAPPVEPALAVIEVEPEASGVIVLADISDTPVEMIERFQPLADYVGVHREEFGLGE